ncbi:hypothetical protein EYF80_045448 [Liparis tanakae]|uniref:Uncharacterized protein n=1 Tax=Liparis tanakae TaxID=230148 RepID=A0A4Z2FVL2_9TELE|nr:hypothetical protein EYF80_045448 [Liparis tanakae]
MCPPLPPPPPPVEREREIKPHRSVLAAASFVTGSRSRLGGDERRGADYSTCLRLSGRFTVMYRFSVLPVPERRYSFLSLVHGSADRRVYCYFSRLKSPARGPETRLCFPLAIRDLSGAALQSLTADQ